MSGKNDFRSLSSSPAAIRRLVAADELGITLVIVGLEGLFEPEQVEFLECPGALDGRLGVEDKPGVDHQIQVGSQSPGVLRAPGPRRFGVLSHRVPAELDGREALLGKPPGALAGFRGRGAEERAGVGTQRLCKPAPQQLPDRQAERLSLDVPEGQVDAAHGVDADSAPATVDVGPVHLVPEILGAQRVFPQEHVGQARGRRVREGSFDAPAYRERVRIDLAVAGDPRVGGDLDDQGILSAIALSLDRGKPQVDRFNAGDFQIADKCARVALRGGHVDSSWR